MMSKKKGRPLWRQNVSGKRQIVSQYPKSIVVEPGEWVRSDVVGWDTDDFSEPKKMSSSFSRMAEVRDVHGNVVRILVPDTGPTSPGVEVPGGSVSVVVPVYGQHEYLANCLRAIRRSSSHALAEVVVVDDKPDEPVPDELAAGCVLVRNERSVGFGAACNRGAEKTAAPWILFLNSDCVPAGDWLSDMLRTARRMAAEVVGARLLYPQSRSVQHGGMKRDGDLFVHEKGRLSEFSRDRHVLAVSGACMLVSRQAWERLGGFDPEYGKGYFEDVDLCLSWIEVGGRVAYCGSTEIEHHESVSQGKRTRAWEERLQRSASVFRKKWPATRLDAAVEKYPPVPRVDIVVAVHNALRQTADCLRSIEERTPGWIDWEVTVLDDASERFVSEWLRAWCREHERFCYVRSEVNRGYLPSIDEATRTTGREWICYVNSDVVVTDGWLGAMLSAAEADPRIKIVNPHTNSAAHLSIQPPPGSNYVDADARLMVSSPRRRFDVVTPVGFCMLVEREALAECGGWDVEYYGRGYGEECDLYMRMLERGYRSVVADDCYVLHEGGATFGLFGSKADQERAGYLRFMKRWKAGIEPMLTRFNREAPHRASEAAMIGAATERPRAVFVFSGEATLCGGVLAVVHICNRLIERGWNATFACTRLSPETLKLLGARFRPLVYSDRASLISGLAAQAPAVIVATIWFSVRDVLAACGKAEGLVPAYFVQDVEYMFRYPSGEPYVSEEEVVGTWLSIDSIVANSDWVLETIREKTGDSSLGRKIGIGVDPLVFYPREKPPDRIVVMAHCRPSTPRRGWDVLARVLAGLKASFGDAVRTVVYDQKPVGIRVDESMGRVSPHELARRMGEAHLFLEGSRFQGWGMQALEAMSCGCALVSTENRGIDNYGTDGYDCVVVPPHSPEAMLGAASALVRDAGLRAGIGHCARETAKRFDWSVVGEAWHGFLSDLFSG